MADAGQQTVPEPRTELPLPGVSGDSGSGNALPPAGAAGAAGGGSAGGGKPPVVKEISYLRNRPYSPRWFKEGTRTLLAMTFAGALLLTIICSFIGAILGPPRWGPVRDWLQIMLPAETGLFGSALGFYFASSASSRDDD
jgi:hypothetical protein